MSIKFRVLGGGGFGGGGKCRFYFYGREDFSELQLDMAKMLQKPMFALPGCQRISVNTLLCDTLGLADLGRKTGGKSGAPPLGESSRGNTIRGNRTEGL